jgi:hypothetical protein
MKSLRAAYGQQLFGADPAGYESESVARQHVGCIWKDLPIKKV